MNSVQKTEHEKNLEHSKKRSRPLLLRPVSGPAKVPLQVTSYYSFCLCNSLGEVVMSSDFEVCRLGTRKKKKSKLF